MRTRLAGVVLWLAATAGATLMVATGVGAIRDAARSDDLVARPPATAATTPTTATTSISSSTTGAEPGADPPAGPATTSPPPASGAAPVPSPTAAPSPTRPPATTATGGSGPAPTAPSAPSVAPAPPATAPPTTAPPPSTAVPPSTTAPATPPVTQTVVARGGAATIRFAVDSVTVVAATPNPGFAARVDQQGATAVRVEFEGDDGRSRIEAWWDGVPRSEVRED